MQSQVPRECSRERLSRPQHHCRPSPGCVSGRRPGRGRASRQDAAREARQHDRPTPVPDRFEILLFVTALRNVVRGAEALLGYEHEAVKSFYMAVPNAKAVRHAGPLRRVMRGIGTSRRSASRRTLRPVNGGSTTAPTSLWEASVGSTLTGSSSTSGQRLGPRGLSLQRHCKPQVLRQYQTALQEAQEMSVVDD
jgi:hypothetical protein